MLMVTHTHTQKVMKSYWEFHHCNVQHIYKERERKFHKNSFVEGKHNEMLHIIHGNKKNKKKCVEFIAKHLSDFFYILNL